MVWRGFHIASGLPVAVKVMTGDHREEEYRREFRNEVRAMAALNHPGIAMVLDHGEVGLETAEESGGQVRHGALYLVMEFASGGTLHKIRRPLPWHELRAVVLSLLDALAHGHARNLIHRDLKPGNVLLCNQDDERPGLKLTDYGIAHLLDWHVRTGSLEAMAGTLQYMAPEQILGRWRNYGPWTDLYSLGCVAYRLASGVLPFHGKRGAKLLRAHLHDEAPLLRARNPVPPGFPGWIRRLLAKEREERFQCAADAAWALSALGDLDEEDEIDTVLSLDMAKPQSEASTAKRRSSGYDISSIVTSSTFTFAMDPDSTPVVRANPMGGDGVVWSSHGSVRMSASRGRRRKTELWPRADVPPFPGTWRRREDPIPSLRLVGAGLGLYGVRPVPLVDRNEERDAIWSRLREVYCHRDTRALLLRGGPGTGKTRLAEWMCARAQEVGAAVIVRESFGPGMAPEEGLRRLVGRALGCLKLGRSEVRERIEDFVGGDADDEVDALTVLVVGEREGDAVEDARARYALVHRTLERVAEARPLIVWLEDVAFCSDAVGLIQYVLRQRGTVTAPILWLMTARDDALAQHPEVAELLRSLVGRPEVDELEIGPLAPHDHRTLVERLLWLEHSVASRVAQRTAGNPQFAVQLVGDWVERGLLQVGEYGFELGEGGSVLPDDMHSVWQARIDRSLEGLPAQARIFLERAAALGQQVADDEWVEACDVDTRLTARGAPANDVRAALVDALLKSRLIRRTDEGWAFSHNMLRESLERMAREQDRWRKHHEACAGVLGQRRDGGESGLGERVGRHLLAAGRLEDALEPLLSSATNPDLQDLDGTLALLGTCEDAMTALGVGEADLRWADVWLHKIRIYRAKRAYDEAMRWSTKLIGVAREQGWQRHRLLGLFERCELALLRRQVDKADATLSLLHRELDPKREPVLFARCQLGFAHVSALRGHAGRAGTMLEQAARMFSEAGEATRVADCRRFMARLEYEHGSPERATNLYRLARVIYERAGRRSAIAACENGMADVLRRGGDLTAALEGYQRALRLAVASGSGDAAAYRLNLSLTMVAQGRFRRAREELETAREAVERQGAGALLGFVHAALLPCTASNRDWAAFEHHLSEATLVLKRGDLIERDVAWLAEVAGDIAQRAGESLRAYRCYQVACAQWLALRDLDRAAQIEQRMATLAP